MSMRQNFGRIGGYRFERTTTERGGLRHYIDGKPVSAGEWQERLAEARMAEEPLPAECR